MRKYNWRSGIGDRLVNSVTRVLATRDREESDSWTVGLPYHVSRALCVGFIEDVDDVIGKDSWAAERNPEAPPANVVGEDLRVIDHRRHTNSPSDRPTVSC